MRSISEQVTFSTIGQQSPSPVTLGGGYRWRNTPGWNPAAGIHGRPAAARTESGRSDGNAGAQARMESKRERFRVFCELRDRDVSVRDAAADMRVNVQMKTAQRYERDRLALAAEQGATS